MIPRTAQRVASRACLRSSTHLRSSTPSPYPSPPCRHFAAKKPDSKEKDSAKPKVAPAPAVRAVSKPVHPSSRPSPPSLKVTPPPISASPLLTALTPTPTYDPNDPIFSLPDPYNPHTPSALSAIAEKYRWINWSRFADHLHRSDVHFFDGEVKYVDQNYDVKPDVEELKKVAALDEMEFAKEEERERLFQLLPFGAYVDRGSHTRVTRFGKVRSTWVMVIAGDQCGTASFGIGKGADSREAHDRAERDLKNNITFLPLIESRTILYPVIGQFGVCKVLMQPLPRGAGMIAGIIPRMVFEAFGIHDISAKVIGRALPKHQVFAIWDGLSHQRSMRELSISRGVKLHRMFERGVEQPRSPPRWVMDERADEIGRKLKEVTVAMEDENAMEAEQELEEAQAAEAEAETVEGQRISSMSLEEKQSLLDRGVKGKDGRPLDADDVMDGDPAAEYDEGENHWGIWSIPNNYVPTMPPEMPFIPPPRPAEPTQLGKGRRVWKRKG